MTGRKKPLQRWCLVSALQATTTLHRKEVYVHGIVSMESGLELINKEQWLRGRNMTFRMHPSLLESTGGKKYMET